MKTNSLSREFKSFMDFSAYKKTNKVILRKNAYCILNQMVVILSRIPKWQYLFILILHLFLEELGSQATKSKILTSKMMAIEQKLSKMSLEEIEQFSIESNPLYLQEKMNIGAARGDVITASLYYNPTFALQHQFIGASRNSGPGLPETYGMYQQPVDVNGVISQRKKVAMQDFQTSLAVFADFDRIFRLRLRQNYWSYLYLTELLRFQEEFLENYKDLLELTKFRSDKGDISYLEYERIELERIQLEREYKNTRINRVQVGNQLRVLIGISDPEVTLTFTGRLEFKSTGELKIDLKDFNPEDRPDLLALRNKENRERLNVELKKREAFPILTLGGEVMNKGPENYTGLYASIPIPIFNRNQGEILKAEELAKKAGLNVESKRMQIISEIMANKNELNFREEQLLEYRKINLLEINKGVQEKSRLAYIRGASNLVTFLEAERNYLNVLRTYYELIYLYYASIDQYKASIGKMNTVGINDNKELGK
jgi:cobalt-zinc-cadmium efflux system outer membrane protein